MTDDAELLRCYAEEKSEEAFAELVRRRIGLVYSVAWRHTRDAQRAEDVTQAVFTALARKAGELARRPVLVGWLYRSAQFAASDAVRAEVRRQAREQEAYIMNESEREASEPDWPALRPVLDEGLNALEERDRDAVLLRFFDGQSFAEIGARLNLTENAARMRVERALGKLHTSLARRGVKSTSAALGAAMAGQAGVAAPAGLAASVTAGALAGVGLTGAAAVGGGVAIFMGTTKMTVAVVGAVVAMGVGAAWWGANRAQDARVALASATREQAGLGAQLDELEARVRAESERVQRAETENARLLAAADRVKEAVPEEAEPITSGMVTARMKRVTALILENGDPVEALREFLWCYDVGLPRISGMAGVRSVAPQLLAKLGERYPPALAALRERRDQAKERSSKNEKAHEAVMELGWINHALKDDAANLALYDQLPPGDRRRSSLALASYDYLVENRHYSAAAVGQSYATVSSSFELMSHERPVPAGTPNPQEVKMKAREDFVGRTARSIEVLAGSGDLANARTLAQRLLAYDGSEATRALVQKHAARAGQPGLLGSLKNP